MLHLAQVVRNGLGDRASTCIDPKTQIVQGKTVCVVSCQRSPEPVFLKWKGIETTPEGDFYVRSGPGNVRLALDSAAQYIRRVSQLFQKPRASKSLRLFAVLDLGPLDLFPVKAQNLRCRLIGDRKKNRVFVGRVLMRVPLPGWHDKDIALIPIEIVRRDLGQSAAAESMVHRRARVTMRMGFFFGAKKLNLAGKRL